MLKEVDWASVRGIIFDAVGTLIEPEPSVPEVYLQAARRQGIDLNLEVVRTRYRVAFHADESLEAPVPLATNDGIERERWRRIVMAALLEIPDPGRAFDELWDHFGDARSWRVFEDVPAALKRLNEAGIPVCVASNFDSRLRGVVLGLPSLNGLENKLIISSEVGFRKPHAAVYETARKSLGSFDPAQILCIGDDPENDLAGPIRSGYQALLLDRRGRYLAHSPRIDTLITMRDKIFVCH